MGKRNISQISDEGYNSDRSDRAAETTTEKIRVLSRENRIFKEKYFVEKVINNSANGIIYKGFRKEDKIPVCVKQVPKSKVGTWSELSGRVVPNEFKMHLDAEKCEGVVQVLDWFERKSSFVCVMERPENSVDLFELSSRLGAFSEDPARIIFSQIVSTCSKLHEAGILHRDIKDENILVDVDTLETKIIDFGCATTFKKDEKLTEIAGTPEFFPPEVYTTGVYSPESCTVWSLGALLFVMLVGDLPFQTSEEITKRVFRYPITSLSEDAQNLLKKMMSLNPAHRPTLAQLAEDKWLKTE